MQGDLSLKFRIRCNLDDRPAQEVIQEFSIDLTDICQGATFDYLGRPSHTEIGTFIETTLDLNVDVLIDG